MGQVSTIISRAKSLDKLEKKLLGTYLLIWAFFHFVLWRGAGYSIRYPLEFFGNYTIIVVVPTVLLSALYTLWTYNHNPSAIPLKIRKRLKVQKQRESLKRRVDQESTAWILHGMENRLILRFLLPLTFRLEKLFPNSQKVWEWNRSVRLRYLVMGVSQAISLPRNHTGYFLQIAEYYWSDNHATFKLCPTIGTTRAKSVITKRLTQAFNKPAKHIKYEVDGNNLYVSVPLSWVIPEK